MKTSEDKPSACSGTGSSSTIPSSPGTSLQAPPPTTKAIGTGSSDTEPGDHKHQSLHSANAGKRQHIIGNGAEHPPKHTNSASAVGGHVVGNAAPQAQSESASTPTNQHLIPDSDSQTEEADVIERQMLSDERGTRIATTEQNLQIREANLQIREENILKREAALLERETAFEARETAFKPRSHAGF